ncbi:hypothetical protein RYX45_14270 [Alkalihalophilus pseudofirmus]|uniref:Lipoprotein n=1 Tax=Alkalihalophilus pseudofirmus TaxID=79885 RepID=A0AAJ2U424_ALKPS|nr:hypothetical protein [Alkalihalophilus pseudofirmus]MDV2886352.1 hypothetical protein [Alkalihalophilus pseudofirmus]
MGLGRISLLLLLSFTLLGCQSEQVIGSSELGDYKETGARLFDLNGDEWEALSLDEQRKLTSEVEYLYPNVEYHTDISNEINEYYSENNRKHKIGDFLNLIKLEPSYVAAIADDQDVILYKGSREFRSTGDPLTSAWVHVQRNDDGHYLYSNEFEGIDKLSASYYHEKADSGFEFLQSILAEEESVVYSDRLERSDTSGLFEDMIFHDQVDQTLYHVKTDDLYNPQVFHRPAELVRGSKQYYLRLMESSEGLAVFYFDDGQFYIATLDQTRSVSSNIADLHMFYNGSTASMAFYDWETDRFYHHFTPRNQQHSSMMVTKFTEDKILHKVDYSGSDCPCILVPLNEGKHFLAGHIKTQQFVVMDDELNVIQEVAGVEAEKNLRGEYDDSISYEWHGDQLSLYILSHSQVVEMMFEKK